jgi:hypothetical protein
MGYPFDELHPINDAHSSRLRVDPDQTGAILTQQNGAAAKVE